MKKLTPNKPNASATPVPPAESAPPCPAPATPGTESPASNSEAEPFISKNEIARRLHVTVRTVERWQRRGLIPYVKFGRANYYDWRAFLARARERATCKPPEPSLLRIPVIGIAGDGVKKETK